MMLTACVVKTDSKSTPTHDTEVSQLNEEVALDTFNGICAAGSVDVVLAQGDKYGAAIRANNQEVIDYLVIYVKNNTLNIETKDKSLNKNIFDDFDDVVVYVTTPDINSIDLTGSGDVKICTPFKTSDVVIQLAGAGDIDIEGLFTCNNLSVSIAGTGDVEFDQIKAINVNTSIAGSGSVEYRNMDVENAVSRIAGAGDIKLQGKVKTHSEDIAGSGTIDTSGLLP